MFRRARIARQIVTAILLSSAGLIGCVYAKAKDEAQTEAEHTGQYKVRLTTDREHVVGTCKFVHTIQPDYNPTGRPTDAQLPSYFRVEAVLLGADTVLVDGRIGEAYICGPGPLNPDGSLHTLSPAGTPPAR
jgi:hypothetical protein